ncbi:MULTISPECIES: RNA methyltransferase [Streptomyces]|uniref:RNA methyltransferase n=1 Tax=Streptomyces TaxID=1883 RepID=UPI0004C9E222|nr:MULTISPECIES: RNA methyltransferase [Streptomyces]MBX4174870.1 RNA methyltransferase [Streptomyces geysiriensis]NUV97347.1 RNA methyltransferase [Streptomyces sp. KAI 90]WDI18129.1 RNA methyltransferase [Streptomyces enissocaesilis]
MIVPGSEDRVAVQRITTRNARFQQLQTLLHNRTKRGRAGEFLVQGVRPITMAVEHGWTVRSLLYDADRPLSRWAEDLLRRAGAERVAMAPQLLAELSEKSEGAAEVLAVVEMAPDSLSRIRVHDAFLGLVFDRPTQPGNIGSIVRSADAFGADGLIVTGHAADPYDPKSVRASTGSFFAVPVVRGESHREVVDWLGRERAQGRPVAVVGTDEGGESDVSELDLTGPVLLLIGNETTGLSAAWREACDHVVSIPMTGSASSLNASNAASVVLYEARRQRLAKQRAAE